MAGRFAQWGNDLYTGRRSYPIVHAAGLVHDLGVLAIRPTIVPDPAGPQPRHRLPRRHRVHRHGGRRHDQQLAIDTVHAVRPDEEPRVTTWARSRARADRAARPTRRRGGQGRLAEAYDVSRRA